MESELFERWGFNGGTWHNGPRKGKQIFVRGTGPGKLAILTTRMPGVSEKERQIIGAFEIGDIDDEGNLNAHARYRIRFRSAEAEQLLFWRYYKNDQCDDPVWGSMLFRYLDDPQVHRLLADAASVAGISGTRNLIDELISRHFGTATPPPPNGALKSAVTVDKKAALARKYPGGEGPEHRALKHWIAKHPEYIGLPTNSVPYEEHLFVSGDCVDIAFELPTGDWAVVEIETTRPLPGAHQAIKYRALVAAQQGWLLDTKRTTGILVAWNFAPTEVAFCKRYGINSWKCKKGQRATPLAAN